MVEPGLKSGINALESGRVYRISPGVHVEAFQEGALVLRLEDRHMFELNPTARDVLAHTDGLRTVAEIAAVIAVAYQITSGEALQDVSVLFQQLTDDGLIEAVE